MLAGSMYNPLISVIVPVFKTEKYLRQCLDSVCGQTYRNLEIICVDDESPDRSGEILEEYARRDPRIKVIHRKNGGLSAARNSGLAAATGEWIAGVDSDDWLEPDIFEKAVPKLTDRVDILVFGTRLVYEPGVKPCGFERYFELPEEGGLEPGDMRRTRINVCFWNKLWRRSFIAENGIAFPEGLIHEDEYLYRCLAFRARCIYILPHIGYNYLQRLNSIVHSGKSELQKYQDRLRIIDKVLSHHVSSGTIVQAREYILPYWAGCWLSMRDRCPADVAEQAMQMNARVISQYGLDSVFRQDLRMRCLLPMPRWKRLFVKMHMRGITYRFFGIHLFTVVYENNRPVGLESSWWNMLARCLGCGKKAEP